MTEPRGGASDPDEARAARQPATEAWNELMERSRQLMAGWQQRMAEDEGFSILNPTIAAQTFMAVAQQLLAHPARLQAAQAGLAEDYARLWKAIAQSFEHKQPMEPVIEPGGDDRRFKDAEWSQNPVFDAIKQYYLLTANWCDRLVNDAPGLDPQVKRRAQFYMRQFMSAIAPTNFVATNPKVLKATLDSQGQNLLQGFGRMLDHMEQHDGRLQIPLSDTSAFELGRNLATT
ncbi:MAG: class I poly(R)-hydroxyalkanoic acid synthase, partial [Rhodospirillales bacterium]|nr:class I poly(R)-hydroxyalkanoic acid synthase [Rhodospirillales bacterium]